MAFDAQNMRCLCESVCVCPADDEWLIIASDGLFANVERGGGGGLDNQQVVDMCRKSNAAPEQLVKKLAFAAQEAGSTDDVTVVVVQLK